MEDRLRLHNIVEQQIDRQSLQQLPHNYSKQSRNTPKPPYQDHNTMFSSLASHSLGIHQQNYSAQMPNCAFSTPLGSDCSELRSYQAASEVNPFSLAVVPSEQSMEPDQFFMQAVPRITSFTGKLSLDGLRISRQVSGATDQSTSESKKRDSKFQVFQNPRISINSNKGTNRRSHVDNYSVLSPTTNVSIERNQADVAKYVPFWIDPQAMQPFDQALKPGNDNDQELPRRKFNTQDQPKFGGRPSDIQLRSRRAEIKIVNEVAN